jgi:ribosomal protein S18 acetylase RimI-like enzyme
MIEFEIMGINETNVDEICQLILDVKTFNGEWSEDVDLERVKQVFLRNFEDTEDSILLAKQAGKLIGLIVIHLDEQDMIEMNPWFLGGHPILCQGLVEVQLGSEMIQRVMKYAESIHAMKVNVHFMKDGPPRTRMYAGLGMKLFEEVTHLRVSLSELEIITPEPSNELDIVPLHEAPIESLYDCWYESFQTGQDRSFFARSREQNREHFEQMFDRDEYDTQASIALMSSGQVVGFALVKQTHGPNNGHIWELGVHPDFKRKGYARLMLAVMRDRLLAEEMKTISLNYDISNKPAMMLYRSYNFEEKWTQIGYTWIVEA